MKHILILGGGYIGRALHDHLISVKSMSSCLLSRSHNNSIDYTKKHDLRSWITSWSKLAKAGKAPEFNRPDFIINACGYTGRPNVDACETDREATWYYNVVAATNIQSVADDLGIKVIHISSGCIYTGYSKVYTEEDEPNFGLFDDASWYSKTKHAGELMLKNNPHAHIMRVRMPFCGTLSERNVLNKLRKYENIIDQVNSMTCVDDLTVFIQRFIEAMNISGSHPGVRAGIYNVVNPHPLSTHEVLDLMREYKINNPKWNRITLSDLALMTAAPRSNCVLSDAKIRDELQLQLPPTADSLSLAMKGIHDKLHQGSN